MEADTEKKEKENHVESSLFDFGLEIFSLTDCEVVEEWIRVR